MLCVDTAYKFKDNFECAAVTLTVVKFPVEHCFHSAVVRKSMRSVIPTHQDKLIETLDAL